MNEVQLLNLGIGAVLGFGLTKFVIRPLLAFKKSVRDERLFKEGVAFAQDKFENHKAPKEFIQMALLMSQINKPVPFKKGILKVINTVDKGGNWRGEFKYEE